MTTKHLQVGDLAPDFSLPSDTGETVTLSSLRGEKVVVYFYPTAMTTGCTTQACDFRDSLDSLKAAGYTVLGISPDGLAKLAEFREHDASRSRWSDADSPVMNDWGTYGEKQQYGKTVLGVIRSTFVIDEEGRSRPPVQRQGHRPCRQTAPRTGHLNGRPGPRLSAGQSGGKADTRHLGCRAQGREG